MNIYLFQTLFLLIGSFICLRSKNESTKRFWFYTSAIFLLTVLVLRAENIGADLGRYRTHFNNFGEMTLKQVLEEPDLDNVGFYLYTSFLYKLFEGRYAYYLMFTGFLTFLPFVRIIKKTSGFSCVALFVFVCLGYYCFLFSGLKQALAMAILTFAYESICVHKRFRFYLIVILASFFHFPALVFLPAYELTHQRLNAIYIGMAAGTFILLVVFRNQLIELLGSQYESVIEKQGTVEAGGKVFLIAAMAFYGYAICPPTENFDTRSILFRFLLAAAAIQTLANFGNVFERLADYYLIYAPLYFSYLLHPEYHNEQTERKPMLQPSERAFSIINPMILFSFFSFFYAYYNDVPYLLPYKTWI